MYKYDLEIKLVKYDCMRDSTNEVNLKIYVNKVKCYQDKKKTNRFINFTKYFIKIYTIHNL